MKKRIISMLLVLITVLGMFPATALAASSEEEALGEVDIYNGGREMSYLSINGRVRELIYTYYNFVSSTGRVKEIPAYCVNPNLYGVPQRVAKGESIQYLAKEKGTDPKVMGIVACGYPTTTLKQLNLADKYDAYYATKMALWCYILPNWDISNLKVNPNLSGDELTRAKAVLAAAKEIYMRGTMWSEVYAPSVTCTPDRDVAYDVTINGKSYKQQIFTYWSKTWVCDCRVNISFDDPSTIPGGTRIVDMNNNDISAITVDATGGGYGAKFKVLYPAESVAGQAGSVRLNFDSNVYQYAIFYAVCAEVDKYGTLQNYMVDTDPTRSMALSAVSSYADNPNENTPDTGLRILKYEEGTTIPLEGARFEVIGPDGNSIGVFSTNSRGEILLPLNVCGNYTVIERDPPQHHLLSKNTTQNVTVVYNEVATATFYNAPYGSLRVQKLSNTGAYLQGVTVQVKHIESGATYTQQTGPAGVAFFDELKPGAYEVRETAGIPGWLADTDTIQTVTVVTGETSDVTITNKELPGLRIIKYDRKNMVAMPDVTFEIWRDGISLGRFRTDQFGEILLTDVEPGTYRAAEVDTGSDGHILDTTPQEIELKAGDGIRELLFFNDVKPGLRLVKVDSTDPSRVIPNAVFEIRSVDGSYGPKEFTTDQNGEIDLSKLPTGAYVITEKSCEGYVIDNAQRIIHLDPNEDAQFVFTNTIKPSLQIIKTSSDGTPLKGVAFRIAKIEDGTHYLDRTTNERGEILISDLEPGVYSVRETATDSSHILDLREYHVELFPGRTSTLTIENQKRPNLIVYKHDADTGEPIADTVFEVRAADGHSVDQIKTDSEGKAELKNLLPGVYEISEKSVPTPWLLDAPSQLVTLYPNRDHTVYFENHKAPTITIEKRNSVTHDPLEHAKFRVFYAEGSSSDGAYRDLGYFWTDSEGKIELSRAEHGIADGWFKVVEEEAPTGFAIREGEDTQQAFVQSGKSYTFRFENVPLSALVVWKYDSVTGEAVQGAVFQVKYLGGTSGTGGTIIGTYKTSANGSFTVTGLREGTYICEELSSDSGHVIDTAPQTAYISGKQQDVIQLYFGNAPKGSLLVKKIDSVTHEPLSDVEFLVTTSDGTVVGNANGKFITDHTGCFTVENVAPSTALVVKETRAKSGYLLDDTAQTAAIKAGQTVTLEFRNAPFGSVLVKKVDAVTKAPISDVEFMVTTSDGTVVGDANGKFVTGSTGTFIISDVAPDTTLVIKEVRAKEGYVLDDTPQTVKVKSNEVVTVEFRNKPKGNLIVVKQDSVTKEPLEGVQFKIVYANGSYVDAESGTLSSNGLYWTDKAGKITISGISGTVVVTEVETIPGYTIDENSRTQTVTINPNDTQTLHFYNDPVGGVEIIKVNADKTSQRIPNTTFEIRKVDDALVDTVTTGKNGSVFCSLPDGAYYAVEVEAADGFRLDNTPHYFEVKGGKTTTLTVKNKALSGILVHKIDSTTGEGIYGVTFLLYDGNKNPMGQYESDQDGYVYITDLEKSGRYYIRELENEGYHVDKQLKTVYVTAGKTIEIEWENEPVTGQIQIYKYAAEYNEVTGTAPGTPLKGAVYEIVNARSGKVLDYITTDARGVAASKPLPLTRYQIREVTAPVYWQVDTTVQDVTLEYAGQIIKLSAYDKAAKLGASITKRGNSEVLAGSQMRYDLTIANTSNVDLQNFYWHDRIPSDIANATTLSTGTYSARLTYRILYKTNYNASYQVLASNLLTGNNYSFALNAIPMQAGEVVTDIYFDFGTVPVGFQSVTNPTLSVMVKGTAVNGYQMVNRADVGGKYQGTWQTAQASWVTIIRSLFGVPTLPKTGY